MQVVTFLSFLLSLSLSESICFLLHCRRSALIDEILYLLSLFFKGSESRTFTCVLIQQCETYNFSFFYFLFTTRDREDTKPKLLKRSDQPPSKEYIFNENYYWFAGGMPRQKVTVLNFHNKKHVHTKTKTKTITALSFWPRAVLFAPYTTSCQHH